jgi:hypothetical protein
LLAYFEGVRVVSTRPILLTYKQVKADSLER